MKNHCNQYRKFAKATKLRWLSLALRCKTAGKTAPLHNPCASLDVPVILSNVDFKE